MAAERQEDAEALADALKALSSPIRIAILDALRVPKKIGDLRLPAGGEWAGFQAERSLTRPAVSHHVEILEQMGFVERVDEEGHYVVNQQRMFAFLEDLGRLARLRPVIDLDVRQTMEHAPADRRPTAGRPRLLLVAGPKEGHALPLGGKGPWTVGRGEGSDLRLEYDPHVSRLHLTIAQEGSAYFAESSSQAKNPALLNYEAMRPGTQVRLTPGDSLSVGSSRLVFQA